MATLIEAKLFPALIFAVLFFVLLFVDLIVADRLAPLARSTGPEDEIIERYRSIVDPYAGRIRFGVAVFFAIVMGSGVASEWRDWILFSNASKFGVKDPQFHRDIGFYVFQLPFLQFIASWTFAALLVVLIITAVFHYLNGGIRLQTPFQRVTPQVKVHISVILALMALTKTVQYYLSRFALTLSHRGTVDGATYTDVKAQLPALNLLMLISVAAAILFIANIFRKGWVFPIIAVGLWGFISIVVGTIYPAIIQRFVVQPNEFAREQTYIKRNIDATRTAFGLDKIHLKSFDYNTDLTKGEVADNKETLDNVRLWDPPEIKDVMSATQEFQPYFKFSDVDIDRYDVNGTRVPALTGVRELDPTNIPSSTWTNRHLVYTHGVGVDSGEGELARPGLARLPPLRPPADGRPRSETARRVLRRGLQRLLGRRHQGRRARGEREDQHRQDDVQGRRRGEGVGPRAPARVRACGSATSTWSIRASSRASRGSCTCATSAAGRDRRAVPAVGPRSVPGRVERADRLDARRVHDDQPVPVLAVDQPDGAGRQRARGRPQLRTQLGEGDRRLLRRLDALLRGRPLGPDHPHVPQGVPRPVRRRQGHAGRAARSLAVPRRHVRHADRAVHAVPHDRPAAVLPEGRAVGRRAEPRSRRLHERRPPAQPQAATTAVATRRSRPRGTRSIPCT